MLLGNALTTAGPAAASVRNAAAPTRLIAPADFASLLAPREAVGISATYVPASASSGNAVLPDAPAPATSIPTPNVVFAAPGRASASPPALPAAAVAPAQAAQSRRIQAALRSALAGPVPVPGLDGGAPVQASMARATLRAAAAATTPAPVAAPDAQAIPASTRHAPAIPVPTPSPKLGTPAAIPANATRQAVSVAASLAPAPTRLSVTAPGGTAVQPNARPSPVSAVPAPDVKLTPPVPARAASDAPPAAAATPSPAPALLSASVGKAIVPGQRTSKTADALPTVSGLAPAFASVSGGKANLPAAGLLTATGMLAPVSGLWPPVQAKVSSAAALLAASRLSSPAPALPPATGSKTIQPHASRTPAIAVPAPGPGLATPVQSNALGAASPAVASAPLAAITVPATGPSAVAASAAPSGQASGSAALPETAPPQATPLPIAAVAASQNNAVPAGLAASFPALPAFVGAGLSPASSVAAVPAPGAGRRDAGSSDQVAKHTPAAPSASSSASLHVPIRASAGSTAVETGPGAMMTAASQVVPPEGTASPGSASAGATNGAAAGSAATQAQGQPAVLSAPPGAQLAQAVTGLQLSPDGSTRLSIRLDPAALGGIQVQITRGRDGSASVSVLVERPDTLRDVQSNLASLHLALDRAGVAEQRTISVHLAPPQVASQDAGQAQPGGAQSGGTQLGGNGSQPSPQGGSHQPPRQSSVVSAGPPAPAPGADTIPNRPAAGARAGIDLVA